jgi:hypothetical protein
MSSFLNLLSLTPALTGCETGGFSKNEYRSKNHLINLCIASQQTTVKITEIIIKIRNSIQDIPIKSLNILKNSKNIYKNIITKKTACIQAMQIGFPCEKAGNL